MVPFHHVVAIDQNRGIGKDGDLVWHLPGDLSYFRQLTSTTQDPEKKNIVIMGRVTWESIPEPYRPLSKRINMILTRQPASRFDESHVYASFDESLAAAHHLVNNGQAEQVFVIGGAQLYRDTLSHPQLDTLYITQVHDTFDCDATYPDFQAAGFTLHNEIDPLQDQQTSYSFQTWTRS